MFFYNIFAARSPSRYCTDHAISSPSLLGQDSETPQQAHKISTATLHSKQSNKTNILKMNTQALIHQAAIVNRDGIAALACGYGEKAHACFKYVLQALEHVIQTPNIAANGPVNGTSLLRPLSPVTVPNMTCERFFVYDRAFLFQPNNQQVVSQVDVTLLSAAAIFNMSLTYHQRAMVGRQSEGMYRVAARMYDQCLQIIGSLPPQESDLKSLQMIVLNNRAHVAYELGDYESSQAALGYVGRLSRRITRECHADPNSLSKVLQESALDEISLNVLTSSPPKTAACA